MPAPSSWSIGSPKALPPSVTIPPMPILLHRKLAVHSTSSGLVLRPFDAAQRGTYRGPAVLLRWKESKPEALQEWAEEKDGDGLTVGGIGGLLKGFAESYLLLITDASVAATLPDAHASKVLSVNSLLAIPLGSFGAARTIISKQSAKEAARHRKSLSTASIVTNSTLDSRRWSGEAPEDSDLDDSSQTEDEADAAPVIVPSQDGATAKRPFWQRAFSRNITKPPPRAVVDVSLAERLLPPTPSSATTSSADPATLPVPSTSDASSLPAIADEATHPSAAGLDDEEVRESQKELDDKLLIECLRTLTGLYYSLDADITRSLQSKASEAKAGPLEHLPLWRRVDRRFWFNAHLMSPFVEAGPYRTLTSDNPTFPKSIDLSLTLISRRSIDRPGLRYQRRGINASGGTANFVETEFIVSTVRDDTRHTCSFVQLRGSIPIYWSQNPFALKPPPVLERTKEESREAMRKHLDNLEERYGRLLLVNLAEQTGKEGTVVEAYRTGVESLKKPEEEIRYVEFDFHRECRGMRYENISNLINNNVLGNHRRDVFDPDRRSSRELHRFARRNALGPSLLTTVSELQRTNVVQSAISRWVLNRHLVHLGITSGEEPGMHDELDVAFNGLWADNGDAISREYAGTSALKGDFTRTGKRNWKGALNDASNSVARLMQSTVTGASLSSLFFCDFFKQAALDYILGINLLAFQEFSERLEASDPGEILRLAKIRQEAIETSARDVLPEGEEKLAGWTLLSPSEKDVVRPAKGGKFEEKVLLLSSKAVYVVGYEFSLQKVVSFTRIPTGDITSVQTGAYILSSLDASTRDPVENYGLVLRYADGSTTERIHTYTLRTESAKKDRSTASVAASPNRRLSALKPLRLPGVTAVKEKDKPGPPASGGASPSSTAGETHFFAFKALRRDAVKMASVDGSSQIMDRRAGDDVEGKTAKDLVRGIVGRLREECDKLGAVPDKVEGADKDPWLVEKDIISLAECRAQTALVDKLSHALYKAIWL
ncbi:SPOSA6832_01253, partial [Sporobolomyces salmonicolor]